MSAKLVFWDVQHGHAAFLQTPNLNFAIDLGTGSHGRNETFSPLQHLKSNGITKLDGVVISHPHRDHIDDIFNFDLLSPSFLWRPNHLTEEEIRNGNQSSDKHFVDAYLQIHRRFNNPIQPAENPLNPSNNGGSDIKVFVPKSCARSNLNNHSAVLVVSYESSKVLIPGDNESPSWNELLSDPSFVQAIAGTDVLLAPHHGREAGYSAALFEHISPKITIVSDGAYGDTSATSRYSAKSTGWPVHRRNGDNQQRYCVTTRNDGVIVVEMGRNPNGNPFLSILVD